MTQTTTQSAIETTINIGSGMVVAWCLTYFVLPMVWGFETSRGDALGITALYTAVSWVRSFAWRRVFSRQLHQD